MFLISIGGPSKNFQHDIVILFDSSQGRQFALPDSVKMLPAVVMQHVLGKATKFLPMFAPPVTPRSVGVIYGRKAPGQHIHIKTFAGTLISLEGKKNKKFITMS